MNRNIIRIDEEKCNGCGLCVSACAEGAIEIVDGKARLISEKYCDGLGACLGECPGGAIIIEEREAEGFDEKAVNAHLHSQPCGCPSAKAMSWEGRCHRSVSAGKRVLNAFPVAGKAGFSFSWSILF